MSSLLLLNGSPRGESGNTPIMLKQVGEGWAKESGDEAQMLNLTRRVDFDQAVEAFGEYETVVLGMPLYTDAMPGLVKTYIEALASYVGSERNPRLGFLVQSGFSEALHSRHLERFLEKLARRLGCEYAGTIVRPSGEGTRLMPDGWNRKLFAGCQAAGAALAAEGRFEPWVRGVCRVPSITPRLWRGS